MNPADIASLAENGGGTAVIAWVLWKLVSALREGLVEMKAIVSEWRRHNERQDLIAAEQLAELKAQTEHLRSIDEPPPRLVNGAAGEPH